MLFKPGTQTLITSHLEALDLWEKLNLYMAASRRNLEEHETKRRKGPKGNFGGALCQAGNGSKGFGVSMGFEAEMEELMGEFFFKTNSKSTCLGRHISFKHSTSLYDKNVFQRKNATSLAGSQKV